MSGPIDFYLNHVLMLDDEGLEWGWSTTETLGGVDSATFVVQDRNLVLEVEDHWDVKAIHRATGWVLFRGEVVSHSLDLPDKFPWRRWSLTCSGYGNQLAQRLVGAFDGKIWIDDSGFGIFVNIDPFASTLATDKLTVQTWLDHYVRVDGEAFDTATYVYQYIDDLFQQDFDYSDVQAALEAVASLVAANLQFWVDPDLKFHWVTIPAWQDLLQSVVAVEADPTASVLATMLPEGVGGELPYAPYTVADVGALDSDIGFSSLKLDFDGNKMPEEVYVKGSTGYVYNAPPIPPEDETKTTVHSPTPGSADRYELTIQSTTKLWHVDGTGYVSTTFASVAPGGPWSVKWVSVPWSQSRNKGGNYWKFLEGPHEGLLADDNTNYLSGYGSILVQKVVTDTGTPTDPLVGVGGSGWTNEVDQDPNERQVYLEAAISSTRAKRDAIGGQALYRGQYPTLRGSVIVRGYHGWRVGQLLQVADVRMPTALYGAYFVIQEVSAKPIADGATDETKDIEYTLRFGDGPESRYSAEPQPGDVAWPPPFIEIDVQAFDLAPGPNSTQTITAQLINGAGEPWALKGKVVNWSFECYDAAGVLQTGQGSIAPTVSITDKNGKARTKLTTGPGTALVYYVFASVKAE